MPKHKTKSKKAAPKQSNNSNNMLLSSEMTRVIKWSHFVQYTASGLSVQTYRLNGLYDPDSTGAGTQPVGFDEIMAFYKYYRVLKAKAKISVVNGGTAAITAAQLSNSSSVPTQITAMAANSYGRADLSAGTYGNNRSVLHYNVDIGNWFGVKELIDQDFLGSASSNPSQTLYLHIGMEEIDLSAKDMSLFVEFEWTTRFLNPVALDNS